MFFLHLHPHVVILAIHVDDCLITGSSHALLKSCKQKLGARYKLTDLGPATWLLGIKISRDLDARTLALSQHAYIKSIL